MKNRRKRRKTVEINSTSISKSNNNLLEFFFFVWESRNRKKEEELIVNVFVMLYFFLCFPCCVYKIVRTRNIVRMSFNNSFSVTRFVGCENKKKKERRKQNFLTGNGKMFYIQMGILPCLLDNADILYSSMMSFILCLGKWKVSSPWVS